MRVDRLCSERRVKYTSGLYECWFLTDIYISGLGSGVSVRKCIDGNIGSLCSLTHSPTLSLTH